MEKTAFTCHRGLYEYNIIPFGLANTPGIFQELMAIVLQDLGNFAMAYLDDIIIFISPIKEHIRHIQIVFGRLRQHQQHQLKLKLSKCNVLQKKTKYLGFIISESGIKADPDKVHVIRNVVPPKCVREVRSFIGMSIYYRRFIPIFSAIAKPLINLTKKFAKFEWTEECQTFFDFLKESLTTVPLLAYPDTSKQYILYTDASHDCIGACLCQHHEEGEKPIYYLSHKLMASQTKWPTNEKEAFAIFYALEKLDQYLHDADFIIRTDHKPLKCILDSPIQNKKIHHWMTNLRGYNCSIKYIEVKKNVCVDMLSCLPHPTDSFDNIGDSIPDITDRILEVNLINSGDINPKRFAQYDHQYENKQCNKEELEIPGFDLVIEQSKDKEYVQLKERLQSEKISSSVASKYWIIYFYYVIYFLIFNTTYLRVIQIQ